MVHRSRPLAVLVFLGTTACSVPLMEAEVRGGYLALDGNFSASAAQALKVTTSARSLGFNENEPIAQPKIGVHWGGWHADARYVRADYSGDGITQATLDFGNGQGIVINTPVSSNARLALAGGTVVYDVLPRDWLEFGIGIGVGFLDYEMEIRSQSGPERIFTDQDLLFPFVAVRMARSFGSVDLRGEAGWITTDFDNEDITYFHMDTSVGYRLFDSGERVVGTIRAGYQLYDIDYRFQEQGGRTSVDVRMDGFYAALSLTF